MLALSTDPPQQGSRWDRISDPEIAGQLDQNSIDLGGDLIDSVGLVGPEQDQT